MTAARARRPRVQHTAVAWQRNSEDGVVKGPIRVVHPVLRRLRVPWQWDPKLGYYVIPLEDLDNVLAGLELDGVIVDYRLAGWS